MKTYKKNGAKAAKMAQLKQNVKQLLTQQAQDHDVVDGSSQPEDPAQKGTTQHFIPSNDTVEEAEEKRKKLYHTSISNTLNNGGIFIAAANSYGPGYASSLPIYGIANLQQMLDDAYNLVGDLDKAETAYKYAVAERQAEFKGLAALCSLIVAEMIMSGALQETIEQVRTLMRLLRGERKVPKDPKDPFARYISVSHVNFEDVVENFHRLILMAAADPNYNPPADAIKIVTLEAKLEALKTASLKVQVTKADATVARIARNTFFNTPATGLCDVFNTAKNVVLTNFGRKSEQFMKIKGLAFNKIRTS